MKMITNEKNWNSLKLLRSGLTHVSSVLYQVLYWTFFTVTVICLLIYSMARVRVLVCWWVTLQMTRTSSRDWQTGLTAATTPSSVPASLPTPTADNFEQLVAVFTSSTTTWQSAAVPHSSSVRESCAVQAPVTLRSSCKTARRAVVKVTAVSLALASRLSPATFLPSSGCKQTTQSGSTRNRLRPCTEQTMPRTSVSIVCLSSDHWRRQLWGTGARAPPRLPAS